MGFKIIIVDKNNGDEITTDFYEEELLSEAMTRFIEVHNGLEEDEQLIIERVEVNDGEGI